MSTGYSLHIGVNFFDPNHYGSSGALKSCENDARYMRKIANDLGYISELVLTQRATRKKVYESLRTLAEKSIAEDLVIITYSGHGSFVPDFNHDELDDTNDETWCLYDAQLIDDEIFYLLSKFKEGVRVLLVTDSCHNGTIYKMIDFGDDLIPKGLDTEKSIRVYQKNKLFYENIPLLYSLLPKEDCKASVITISACSDFETTGAGNERYSYSLFTKSLKTVWDGNFKGNYSQFVENINKQNYGVEPQISFMGKHINIFKNQQPFAL